MEYVLLCLWQQVKLGKSAGKMGRQAGGISCAGILAAGGKGGKEDPGKRGRGVRYTALESVEVRELLMCTTLVPCFSMSQFLSYLER